MTLPPESGLAANDPKADIEQIFDVRLLCAFKSVVRAASLNFRKQTRIQRMSQQEGLIELRSPALAPNKAPLPLDADCA